MVATKLYKHWSLGHTVLIKVGKNAQLRGETLRELAERSHGIQHCREHSFTSQLWHCFRLLLAGWSIDLYQRHELDTDLGIGLTEVCELFPESVHDSTSEYVVFLENGLAFEVLKPCLFNVTTLLAFNEDELFAWLVMTVHVAPVEVRITEVHEVRISSVLDLLEIVHVELNGRAVYLSDEALESVLLEHDGQHVVDELLSVLDNDGVVVCVPAHSLLIGVILCCLCTYIEH